jgi:hypothetical protein
MSNNSSIFFFVSLIGLDVSEYIAEPGILSRGLEQDISAGGNFCHSKSGPEGSSRSEQILGLVTSRYGNVLHRMTWLPLVSTNKNAYIRCRGEELCSNPANWQWETCVSLDATVWRWYVAGTSHPGRRGLFVSTSQVNGRVLRLRKFVIINTIRG